jgi:hypothetical protein
MSIITPRYSTVHTKSSSSIPSSLRLPSLPLSFVHDVHTYATRLKIYLTKSIGTKLKKKEKNDDDDDDAMHPLFSDHKQYGTYLLVL